MKHKDLLDYDLAYHALEHMTVARVVRYLTYIFDAGTHEICVFHNCDLQEICNPIDLMNDNSLMGCLASKLRLQFWGGPPGSEEWYRGTLLTMLMDKLFFCAAMDYDNVIDKFLSTLTGGSKVACR